MKSLLVEIQLKQLLKKYIRHVEDCEGINFISDCSIGDGLGGGFTQEEIDILKAMEKEVELERNS